MLKDLLIKNRSYRGFDESVKVDAGTLRELVDCARVTASSRNAQPLKFVAVSTPELVARLQALTHWAALLPKLGLPREGHRPTAFVVICHDADIAPDVAKFQKDVGITAQSMLLAAVEKGFGGCMIGNFVPKSVAELLELPGNLEPQLVVAFGKPDERIVLTPVLEDGSIKYYRDDEDVHYVPKRALEDILIEK